MDPILCDAFGGSDCFCYVDLGPLRSTGINLDSFQLIEIYIN
jgi:hypothetical protein